MHTTGITQHYYNLRSFMLLYVVVCSVILFIEVSAVVFNGSLELLILAISVETCNATVTCEINFKNMNLRVQYILSCQTANKE